MAIFTGTRSSYSYDPAYESYGNAIGGGVDAVIEGFSDELAVIEAMHAFDMAEIELAKKVKSIREAAESGEKTEEEAEEEEKAAEEAYAVTKEASGKEIWAKIRAWFHKLWEKVKAFFAGLIRNVSAMILTPKAFLKQYREKLSKLKHFEVKVTTYEYDKVYDVVNSVAGSVQTALNMHDKAQDAWVRDLNDLAISRRAKAMGNNSGLTNVDHHARMEELEEANADIVRTFVKAVTGSDDTDEFTTNLYAKLRGGKEPKEVVIKDIKPYINIIDKSSNIVESVKAVEKKVNDYCSALNSEIEKQAKTFEKPDVEGGDKVAAFVRKSIAGYSTIQGYVNRSVTIITAVVKEACSASKSILNAAMSPKNAK